MSCDGTATRIEGSGTGAVRITRTLCKPSVARPAGERTKTLAQVDSRSTRLFRGHGERAHQFALVELYDALREPGRPQALSDFGSCAVDALQMKEPTSRISQ